MKFKSLIFMGFLAMFLVFASCESDIENVDNESQIEEKLDVIVSILPQKAFVEYIGGDLVNVQEIIPPGSSPATYEPKPSDLAKVEGADIYFRIGHIPFEKVHLDTFVELNPEMRVVDTSENVDLRYFSENEAHSHDHEDERHEDEEEDHHANEHSNETGHEDEHRDEGTHVNSTDNHSEEDHQGEEHHEDERHADEGDNHSEENHKDIDPHIWLSPMQVKNQVDTIAKALANQDPTNANVYLENAENFKQDLDNLHDEIEMQLADLQAKNLMVFHPSWGYFADEYGLEQIAIEQSGKEPTARELQNLIDEANEMNINVIFVQSQFNKNIAESIADEIGAVVVSIDPLSQDYLNNLRSVANVISESLGE